MSEVRFGINNVGEKTQQVFLAVPTELWDQEKSHVPSMFHTAAKAIIAGCVAVEVIEELETRVIFDYAKIGRRLHPVNKRNDLSKIVSIINNSQILSDGDEKDSNLEVLIGGLLNDGMSLDMHARIKWPNACSGDIEIMATKVMRRTAEQLRYSNYKGKSLINDLVYAQVNRQQGISLQTHPIGACSLDTDGSFYDPDEPTAELHSHNLYSVEQQLIVFSGSVAIANADELV